ncbi:MAG: bifunctional oligoribonuclease/PAP phosphatase NrnA [Gemmatimonadales bacterium]
MDILPHRLQPARLVADRLTGARSIAVATHLGGDGDGWGSACAVAHHFGTAGTEVRLLAASAFPDRYRFLLPKGARLWEPDEAGLRALRTADVQLVVDASEPGRLGDFAPDFSPERTVVIDHHAVASEHIETAVALIDPIAAATAELVYDVLALTDTRIGVPAARSLYVGVVTDTGSFRYSNTTPHCHRLAAKLIEAGADPEALYRPLFATLSPAELAILQTALAAVERDSEYGLTWAAVDADTSRRLGALDEYEGVIEHLRNLAGTEIAILFRELAEGGVKISFRSTGAADVAALAKSFGGGGHEKAAGATVSGEMSDVMERVLEASRTSLAGLRSSGS